MIGGVPVPFVRQLPQVDAVAEQLVQVLLVDARAAAGLALLRRPGLGSDAVGGEVDGDLNRPGFGGGPNS